MIEEANIVTQSFIFETAKWRFKALLIFERYPNDVNDCTEAVTQFLRAFSKLMFIKCHEKDHFVANFIQYGYAFKLKKLGFVCVLDTLILEVTNLLLSPGFS